MTTSTLSDDDVRDLFSEHLDGSLDADTARAVDLALASNAALAAEHRAFAQTLSLLAELPNEDAPPLLVGRVRDRLTAERRQQLSSSSSSAANDDVPSTSSTPWWSPLRLTAGLAAAAAVVAVVMVASPTTTTHNGVLGAAMVDAAVEVRWQAPGVGADIVVAAAREAGMQAEGNGYVGDRQAAARFFVALKAEAASSGTTVAGAVPEQADRVVVVVER